MIQKPNIKFSNRDTISWKDTSTNSHFFPTEISPKNLDNRFGQKQGRLWQSRKTDHNLGYRDPILVIQKPNIKFSDIATISLKDTSINSLFF